MLDARAIREVARSDGNVLYWIVGEEQKPGGRVRQAEDTLAACLGGRSAGWDYCELMPR